MDALPLLVRRRILCELCDLCAGDGGRWDATNAHVSLHAATQLAATSRGWARAWRAVQCTELVDTLALLQRCSADEAPSLRLVLRPAVAFELRRSAPAARDNPALPAMSAADLLHAAKSQASRLRVPGEQFGVPAALFALRNASVGELIASGAAGRQRLVAAVRAERAGAVAHELVARTCQLTLRSCSLARTGWHFGSVLSDSGVASAADALLHFWPHEYASAAIVGTLSDAQCLELARACDARLAACRRWRCAVAVRQIGNAPPALPDSAVQPALRAVASALCRAECARHGSAVTLHDAPGTAHPLPLYFAAHHSGVFVCATPLAGAECGSKRALGHLLRDTLCATRYAPKVILCTFDADGRVKWTAAAHVRIRPGVTHSQLADALMHAARRGAMRDAAVLCRSLRARAAETLARAGGVRLHAFCGECARRAPRHCKALPCASNSPHCPGAPPPSTPERNLHAIRHLMRAET